MKMPSVTISFTEAATAAVKRGERGIIAMILKDIVPAENPVRCVTEEDIPAELSEAGKQQIRLALKGYVNTPNSVIVYMIGKSEENYETALNYLKTVRFDYLVAPSVETDGQLSAVTSYVKNERKANKLIKAVLPNVTADSEGIINYATETVYENDTEYTTEQYCSRIAGIIAGTPITISCTYAPLPELTDCTRLTSKEADAAAEALGINADGVLIGSTGVIGKQLPIDRIVAGVKALAEKKNDTLANGTEAAKAIMTTDTCEKQIAVEIEVAGKTVTIGGMAKGSGMIHPNMCTMLSFITTDAAITKEALQKALSDDVNDTYNMISVDGDTSTNDSVVLLANGMAENEVITVDSESYKTFAEALHEINEYLAKKIAGDGEGATALFEVTVVGADTKETAKTLAKSIVCSNLTKAAIAGHDANWGRILCAMGYSGAQFDPEKVDLFFESKAGKIQIIENGTAVDYSEEKATEILSQEEVKAVADVKMGSESATAWGCDLTHGYIDINADYRS